MAKKQHIGFGQRQEETAPLFARIPREEAEKLERAAQSLRTSKQSIITTLLRALEVEGDAWTVGRAHSFRAPELGDVLTVEQLAELLQVDVATIRRLAGRGELPGRKVGRDWRFSRRAVLEWLGGGADG
jgi:excisionase family DNA binding protein